MARAEVWEAMIRERIILFQALIRKLDRQPENNPAARWRATVGLTTDYCPENRPGRMSEVHSTAAVFNLGQVFFEIRPAAPAAFPGVKSASASSAGLFPASDRVAVSFGYILPGRFAFTRVAFPWQAGPS